MARPSTSTWTRLDSATADRTRLTRANECVHWLLPSGPERRDVTVTVEWETDNPADRALRPRGHDGAAQRAGVRVGVHRARHDVADAVRAARQPCGGGEADRVLSILPAVHEREGDSC
jgi:hypothetical protein